MDILLEKTKGNRRYKSLECDDRKEESGHRSIPNNHENFWVDLSDDAKTILRLASNPPIGVNLPKRKSKHFSERMYMALYHFLKEDLLWSAKRIRESFWELKQCLSN